MTNFDGKEMREEFNKVFNNGNPNPSDFGLTIKTLTPEQLWWLVKFAKHIRGRCRSNAALNNYLNRNFAPAEFRETTKTYLDREGKEISYQGLQIKVGENISEGEENNE